MTSILRIWRLAFVITVLALISGVLPTSLWAFSAESEAAPFLTSETRKVYDLGGTWQRIEDGVATSPTAVPGELDGSEPVRIRRTLRIDSTTLNGYTWHLHLFGLVDAVELLVNGRFVMRYPGGMVPFSIRIREGVLRAGQNTIELLISPTSKLALNIQRLGRNAPKQLMGVLREIYLVGTPHIWTDNVRVRTSLQPGIGSVAVSARVMSGMIERLRSQTMNAETMPNATIAFGIEGRLIDRSSGITVSSTGVLSSSIGRSREVSPSMNLAVANPRLWSPTNPNLYDLEIRLLSNGVVVDVYRITIGFRSLRIATVEGLRKILLNDTVLPLHAVDYVEDGPNTGPVLTKKQIQHDVTLLKTLGVNAIRVVHGSPHPYLLSLCDRYGILVMADLPCSDVPSNMLEEQELTTRYRNSAERTVAYLDMHPSVMAIGLSDGLDEKAAAVSRYHQEIGQYVRRNSSKLIYKIVSAKQLGQTSDGGFDIIVIRFHTLADSVGLAKLRRKEQSPFASAAVLAGFGGLVSPANTNGFSDPLSNEAQALLINKFYSWSSAAQLAGVIVWTFADYRLDRPTMLSDHYDAYICTSGLVDTYRQRRVSYEMYKALINDEKLPLLQARKSGFDTPIIFIITGLILGIALALLSNRSRRFREYVVRALLRPYNFYADIRDQRILSTAHTGALSAVIAGSVGLVFASFFFFVRIDPDVENILHVLIWNDGVYELIRFIAWHPGVSVLAWSILVLVMLGLLSVSLRLGATLVRSRITVHDTFTIVVWSGLPYLIMLPIGIALYQALSTNALSIAVPVTMAIVSIWVLFRMLRATSVVFDVRPSIIYVIGFGLITALIAAAFVSLDMTNQGFSFLTYYLNVAS